MSGETDLGRLLTGLRARQVPGEFVYVSLSSAPDVAYAAMVVETEGVTVVVERAIADEHGWAYDFVAGWITLDVHSALAAVGLTAVISGALAKAGIPANMLAGYYHDHVLVPVDQVVEAVAVLSVVPDRN